MQQVSQQFEVGRRAVHQRLLSPPVIVSGKVVHLPVPAPTSVGLETNEYPNAERIQRGNSDLADSCQWEPPQGEPDRPLLPGHEHWGQL